MSKTKRNRIIKDIINHAIEEEEVGGGGSFSDDDLTELKNTLESQSESELESWWYSNVGEWIASMQRWNKEQYHTNRGTPIWEYNGFDNVVDWQYNRLINEGVTDYGYIHPQYTQPY